MTKDSTSLPVDVPKSRTNCVKYRNWTELSMCEAMNAVQQQGMSVNRASIVYEIPRSTLNDHLVGRVLPGAKSGAPTLLSTREEQERVDFLCHCAEIGYAKTRHEVMDIVTRMLQQKGTDRTVTRGWRTKFITRHHEVLSLRPDPKATSVKPRGERKRAVDSGKDRIHCTPTHLFSITLFTNT